MLLRLLSTLIVLFWLGTVGWLCTVVFAPPESRMTEVDVREVYDVFFNWNEGTTMTLLESGARRGELRIAGSSGPDIQTGEINKILSLSGTLEKYEEKYESSVVDTYWKGNLIFDEEVNLDAGDFSVRIPRSSMTAFLSFEKDPAKVSASAQVAGKELFKFGGDENTSTALPLNMLPMGAGLGLGQMDLSSIRWRSVARVGEYSFGGRDMRAYLLILRAVEQDMTFRVYFSEVGQPLKVETDFGFEAISEILVPLEAYRKSQDQVDD